MYSLVRPLLFKLDPERAHNLSLAALQWLGRLSLLRRAIQHSNTVTDARLTTQAFGLTFQNPIGLAAGYDKNGVAINGLAALGFGHLEIGTLTTNAQSGNSQPRLHRVVEREGIINSLGFPNAGVEAFVRRSQYLLRPDTRRPVIGINIGKSKTTALEAAADEYVHLLARVYDFADYICINISSPNTIGLRQLQARAFIEQLLSAVNGARRVQTRDGKKRKPILVKIAPDLTDAELDDALSAITGAQMDGVIATNTTIRRDGIPARYRDVAGGLSGAPLRDLSTDMIRRISQRTQARLPIVGVGGVSSAADARAKLDAGACLVQLYSGLIYQGPRLVREINRTLMRN
jgi:dihydroorotate dehydrogenase